MTPRPTTRPMAPTDDAPTGVATVPVAGPCQKRALVDAWHRKDAIVREINRVRGAMSTGLYADAEALYWRERAEHAARTCGCGAPAVGRTGECQGCAIQGLTSG